ncbi:MULTISPECIES: N-acetylglucosamine-specific PTS transporter subunit IIBC [unclassified Novosphingobium]|uniref:N-acetylglucosamine-specific PTS transporter subunit IIBC n=1 Tax=unclassified Novosphingobium TaxID=2644732 RepID=UPI000D4D9CF2|nr:MULTISPECIES: N-acetylglucosamine-specific PTS transporter subunit IIBC [unclassified Novosphingobium]PTR13283.1 PTS system N-acetylglucosamine-specific IIB component (Glc family) /PTS system N-acetylglucosamine-specific IIC component (Glc family) [Novosphingobium sp. GV055]PUB07502.1 PTS system N-acetylglucosamine-specific IIB component (Glc family) /PTS system N-acetylglucosamine-specific IIC component (Glc family) [Novosphingobium sp. GV061]PUB23315.1 PTS system N-acetylglucosamine-specifi
MSQAVNNALQHLQSLGRALMLPIAVLPVAALLLRLGQPDLLGLDFVSAAGNAMFANLGLLFAIGVATGFAKDGNGAAPLAGVVCFLVASEGAKALLAVPADVVAGVAKAALPAVTAAWRSAQVDHVAVPLGIVSGIIGGIGYNRFSTVKPPEYLAFFGGRRFVPIISGVAGVALAGLLGASLASINAGANAASEAALASGGIGLFIFGTLNRLLLVTGLHHILNNIAWFVLGDYHGTTGDLRRFFAGDPTAGAFMSGFFPVMMFGLPAACLAMYHTARPERRKATGGMLLSLAATSFLTGVTEPIEFSFMFLAPVLYAFHAVLTGIAMALMAALGVHMGFGFSAGLLDYVLNFSKAQKPLLLIPVGLVYASVYYGVFRWAILRFDLKTPGRDDMPMGTSVAPVLAGERGQAFVAALGGAANLVEVGACTTRLRLVVADQAGVDEAALRGLGAKGLIRPSPRALQVVLGPQADQVAVEIRAAMGAPAPSAAPAKAPITEAGSFASAIDPASVPAELAQALGGTAALAQARSVHGRLLLPAGTVVDESALAALGARGVVATPTGPQVLFAEAAIAPWRA